MNVVVSCECSSGWLLMMTAAAAAVETDMPVEDDVMQQQMEEPPTRIDEVDACLLSHYAPSVCLSVVSVYIEIISVISSVDGHVCVLPAMGVVCQLFCCLPCFKPAHNL